MTRLRLANALVAGSALSLGLAGCGSGSGAHASGCPVSRQTRIASPVRPAARAYWPWAGRSSEVALGADPIYLLILSSSGSIARDGDEISRAGISLHRALIAIAPTYRPAVELHGPRLGFARVDPGYARRIKVSGNIVSAPPVRSFLAGEVRDRLRIRASAGWRVVSVAIRLGRGCQRVSASGPGLEREIVFRVPA